MTQDFFLYNLANFFLQIFAVLYLQSAHIVCYMTKRNKEKTQIKLPKNPKN